MLKIGLTGGIGSGKTIVANIFRVLGIPVFDADREAKAIMENDKELVAGIRKLFGEISYQHGRLNRSFIAGIVFENAHLLEQLNAIVHPATIAAASKWMLMQNTPYVVKEAALLFEAKSASLMDYVIGVHAPLNLRLERTMDRDRTSRHAVLARMNKQLDETEKMNLCDFVVINDGQQSLIPQILTLHKKFLHESGIC